MSGMARRLSHVLAPALVLAGVMTPAVARAGGCAVYFSRMQAAYKMARPGEAAQVLHEAERAHVCSGEALRRLGEYAALSGYRAAYGDGVSANERIWRLKQALRLGRPWQALAALGDEMLKRGKFARAALLLEEAANGAKIPPAVLRTIRAKARFSALAAPGLVPLVMRCGQPRPGQRRHGAKTALALASGRGCVDARTPPLPVPFRAGSARLDARGRAFAAGILAWARYSGAERIILTGYSDPKGNALANFRLAMRRAKAVRLYLRKHGLAAGLVVRAHGEALVPKALSGAPEHAALRALRRVDVRMEKGGAS